jgi:hypothetical protein
MYDVERITIEVVSAIACFILVRFMAKPFRLTGETRYLGLPLGFGFLGVSHAFTALSFALEALEARSFVFASWWWVELVVRAFAFLFLAMTYYFSKLEKKTKPFWNITLGVLVAALTILTLLAIIFPQLLWSNYLLVNVYVRFFCLMCLFYISIHALKSHVEQSDPKTLMVPLGYILLGIGQYSSLIAAVDLSIFPLFGALALRLAGLAVFLFVSYKAFYGSEKGE